MYGEMQSVGDVGVRLPLGKMQHCHPIGLHTRAGNGSTDEHVDWAVTIDGGVDDACSIV